MSGTGSTNCSYGCVYTDCFANGSICYEISDDYCFDAKADDVDIGDCILEDPEVDDITINKATCLETCPIADSGDLQKGAACSKVSKLFDTRPKYCDVF